MASSSVKVAMKSKGTRRASANLSEIAEAAGVSKMTVSRVLRNTEGFSEATRRRVLEEVERQGYLPNRLAAAFGPSSASTLIGVCVPRLSSHFFGLVLESIERNFQNLGYQAIIGSHNDFGDDEELWLKNILSWRPAGVLLASRQVNENTRFLLKDAGIPVVEFWDLNTEPMDLAVGFDDKESGYDMATYALSKGYRRAALLGASINRSLAKPKRFVGFEAAFVEGGGEVVEYEILSDTPGFYAGYYGTENLINHNSNIDMLYCQDDTMALGAFAWCQRKNIRVPEDLGIAGWGDHEAASIMAKRLTTTNIPTLAVGKQCAEIMVRKLRQESVRAVTKIPTHLVNGATL